MVCSELRASLVRGGGARTLQSTEGGPSRSFSLNRIDAAYLFCGGADPKPPEELLAGGRERGRGPFGEGRRGLRNSLLRLFKK